LCDTTIIDTDETLGDVSPTTTGSGTARSVVPYNELRVNPALRAETEAIAQNRIEVRFPEPVMIDLSLVEAFDAMKFFVRDLHNA
jgi:hypothetical protein